MKSSGVYHDSTFATHCTVDESIRLEFVPLPVWSQSVERGNPMLSIAPHEWPCVGTILGELRRTDNIFVTEIGEKGLLKYLQYDLMTCSNRFASEESHIAVNLEDHQLAGCDWEFQDDASFRYLMEILEANMIYFLKRRYFHMERCRETGYDHRGTTTTTIAEDFQTVFGKPSSTQYLANRERVEFHCFKKTYQQKGRSFLVPEAIRKALARLHHRAGIYFPERSYPNQHGIDSYWIDLWWVCSTLLLWILEPCVEITVSLEVDQNQLHKKECAELPTTLTANAVTGFAKQSRQVATIPFRLLRANTQKLGLFYDRVLLHEGPWDEEEDDEEYTIPHNRKDCKDDDDGSKFSYDPDDSDDDIAIVAKISTEAKELGRNQGVSLSSNDYWEGDGIGSKKRNKDEEWEGENRKRSKLVEQPSFNGDVGETDDMRLKAVYDLVLANANGLGSLDAIGGNAVEL